VGQQQNGSKGRSMWGLSRVVRLRKLFVVLTPPSQHEHKKHVGQAGISSPAGLYCCSEVGVDGTCSPRG
jgi:hypothetical protein